MNEEKTIDTEVVNENEMMPNIAKAEEVIEVYNMDNPETSNPGYINVTAKKAGKSASVYFNFGRDYKDMITLFDAEVIFSQARAQMKIKLQSALRSYLALGKDIEELMAIYKPGITLERTPADMGVATEKYFSGLTDAEQEAMLQNLIKHREGK